MRSPSIVLAAAVTAASLATVAAAPGSTSCKVAGDAVGDVAAHESSAFDLVSMHVDFLQDHVVISHEVADLQQVDADSTQAGIAARARFSVGDREALLVAEMLPLGYPNGATLTGEDRVVDQLDVAFDYENDRILTFVPIGAFEYVLGEGDITVTKAEMARYLRAEYPTGHPAVYADVDADAANRTGGVFNDTGITCL